MSFANDRRLGGGDSVWHVWPGQLAVVDRAAAGGGVAFFCLPWRGYDPQRGWIKQRGAA